jgi:hypothetical protein
MAACFAAAVAVVALLCGGCAGYSPQGLPQGSSRAEVIARMGQPTASFVRPGGGERLEFWRGRYAKHTFMVDFDAQDRMLAWQQVRTEADFSALRHGMSKAEVLWRIGHPSQARMLPRQQHQLWSYRYVSPFCLWFQVSLDTQDRVVELGNNEDPVCTSPW